MTALVCAVLCALLCACNAPKTVKVTFDADGGSAVAAQTVTVGKVLTEPDDPEKSGFVFGGWYDGEAPWDFATPVTKALTLKARWVEERRVDVRYHMPDGSVQTSSVTTGSRFEEKQATVGDGMTLDGWYTQANDYVTSSTRILEELDVYANVIPAGLSFEGFRLTGYSGTATELTVPGYAKGVRIEKIGERAFYGSSLTAVTLSPTVDSIEQSAFEGSRSLSSITLVNGLRWIHNRAFYNCTALEELYVPDTVEMLGQACFGSDLSVVDIGDEQAAVPKEASLTSLSLPYLSQSNEDAYVAYLFGAPAPTANGYFSQGTSFDGSTVHLVSYLPVTLTEITLRNEDELAEAAFFGCLFLENVDLSGKTVLIGDRAFEGAQSLDVHGLGSVTEVGERSFLGSGFQGERMPSLTEIGAYAFAATPMTQFELCDRVRTIGEYAFSATKLTRVDFPASLEELGSCAYYATNELRVVTFASEVPPDTGSTPFTVLSEDGKQAYYSDVLVWVKDLNAMRAYRNDLYLRDYASGIFPVSFQDHTGAIVSGDEMLGYIKTEGETLTEVIVPNGVRTIGDYAFYNCATITTLRMPEGFEKIGKYAFYNCTGMQFLDMASTLKEIDDYAFTGFFVGNDLSRLYLPEGLTRIGEGAFMSCFNLRIVELPSTLTYVGYLAFGMSNSLEKIYFNSVTPPTVGSYVNDTEAVSTEIFSIVNSALTTIYVPFGQNGGKSIAETYRSADGFSSFASYIKARPDGAEVGHYGDGQLFVDLDGCDQATIYTIGLAAEDTSDKGGSRYEYVSEVGTYTLTGAVLSMSFAEYGTVTALYGERTIRWTKGGTSYVLSEPKHYYDSYNWTSFKLYDSGLGVFDMYGSFLTPFEWAIAGESFSITLDANNKLPENEAYAGVRTYQGTYDAVSDTFGVSFMMNDYYELMQFSAGRNDVVYASGASMRVYGKYVVYSDTGYAMFTLTSYGNGLIDVALGESVYEDCTYTYVDGTVTIDVMSLIVTLTMDENGCLYGDFMGMPDTYFVYEDELLDSTKMPD